MDFEDINCENRSYDKMASYHQSKLANLLFTKELHNKTKDHATRIFSLNRGFVVTELGWHSTFFILYYQIIGVLYRWTPVQEAQTAVYCAVEDGLENHSGGGLFQ